MPDELRSTGDKEVRLTGRGQDCGTTLDIELSILLPLGSSWLRWHLFFPLVTAHIMGLGLLVWV